MSAAIKTGLALDRETVETLRAIAFVTGRHQAEIVGDGIARVMHDMPPAERHRVGLAMTAKAGRHAP